MIVAAAGTRLVETAAIAGATVVLALALTLAAGRLAGDPYARHHLKRIARYTVVLAAAIALLVVWKPFGGRGSVVVGLFAAGLAFAMQEVVGALAGWFNIMGGRIYRVGDRIELSGVHGDVIDITLLRTVLLEVGTETQTQAAEPPTWVRGRQPTGRIVAVSNKATFTSPVYNYSAVLEFVWEELTVPVPYDADWHEAERLLVEEAQRASDSDAAREAMEAMRRRYPIPQADVEPRVFVRMTDNWMELSARFVVPVRSARRLKTELSRRLRARLDEAGIAVASATLDVSVRRRGDTVARAP
jgi:small-conductance mechanosensitive channel